MPSIGHIDLLQEATSALFVPARLTAPGTVPYQAEVADASVGPMTISRIACTPTRLRRPARMITSTDRELVKFILGLRGNLIASQDGRQGRISPGCLLAYDTSRPYELVNLDPCDIIVIAVPRQLLGPGGDLLRQRSSVPIPGDQGIRSVITTFFAGLADAALADPGTTAPAPDRVRLADAAASLLVAALAGTPGERAEGATSLADQMLAYALANLHDPGLSAGSVARRFGISQRYLHRLMRSRDVQFGSWVRRERLTRIRRDLLDPRLAHWTAAAIAARWGIHDPGHLSRALRAEFGQSAAEIRAAARSPY